MRARVGRRTGRDEPRPDLALITNLVAERLRRERHRLSCADCGRALGEVAGFDLAARRRWCRACAERLDDQRGAGAPVGGGPV